MRAIKYGKKFMNLTMAADFFLCHIGTQHVILALKVGEPEIHSIPDNKYLGHKIISMLFFLDLSVSYKDSAG
jgi:hypothetical protein